MWALLSVVAPWRQGHGGRTDVRVVWHCEVLCVLDLLDGGINVCHIVLYNGWW